MTTTDKQPKPESLEAKFKLLQLLPYDPRAKRKHILVYGFILDWYHSKYGDALASVRHIVGITKERDPSEKGLYAGDIHKALTDLVTWGYLDQQKGSGRKASRYVPIWEKLASVRKIPNTTEDEASVRENTNTCVRENTNATDLSVRDSSNEDPSTPTRVQDPETGVDMHCALPVAGLEAAPAVATEKESTPFHKLWLAYDVKKSLADAEAEFAKRTWDMEALIAAATAWREAWKAQGKPDAPRKRLHVWLRDRHYMEDPPSAYKPKERAPKPVNDNKQLTGGHERVGNRVVDIVDSDVTFEDGKEKILLDLCEQDVPFTWRHTIDLSTPVGDEEFDQLCKARGLEAVNDTSELHGLVKITTTAAGRLFYQPTSAKKKAAQC